MQPEPARTTPAGQERTKRALPLPGTRTNDHDDVSTRRLPCGSHCSEPCHSCALTSARAPQDHDPSTPEQAKSVLDTLGVEYEDDATMSELTKLIRKRRKAVDRAEGRAVKVRKIFAASNAHTITSLSKYLQDHGDIPDVQFTSVKGTIDTVDPAPLMKLKHNHVGTGCRGIVEQGQCVKCENYVLGVLGYSFCVTLRDKDQAERKLNINVNDAAGQELFKLPATQMVSQSIPQQNACIETIDEEDYVFGISIRGRVGDRSITAYNVNKWLDDA